MSTAALSLSELFDFEGNFEDAAQAILTSAGINAYISQQTKKLPLINTGVNFDCGPAIDEVTFLPQGGQPAGQSSQEYFRYIGSLELRVEVNRDTAKQPPADVPSFLAAIRAMVRASFMWSQWPFDDTNLPLYRVSNIRPNGSTDGFDGVRNVDVCTMRFEITFAIQPTAWPVGFPPS